ncbi:MAG: chemotaxis protein CheX [Deltaproteobacteria bacterium]|nr:chemotaxis protein CheX [Deltaproteobacteria bacterium]
MNVKYMNPFIIATQVVFRTMLGIDVRMGKPELKKSRRTSGDVTGIMGLAGDERGTLCVSFRKEGALHVYNTLMGETRSEINEDVVDAIGELTNIISGQARKEFEKNNIRLKAAIPMVVVGRDVEMNFITTLPIVSIPFYFSVNGMTDEVMYLDFSFEA